MSKLAVRAVNFFESVSGTGLRGHVIAGFLSGVMRLIKPRRERIDLNLRLVYPEQEHPECNAQWRAKIRTQLYQNLAWTLTEILALQRDKTQALDWVIDIEGRDILEKILARDGGAIMLTGHFGDWELLGSWYSQVIADPGCMFTGADAMRPRELHAIYQELHDRDLSNLLHEMREHTGMHVLPKGASTIEITRMLREGKHVAALADVSWLDGVKLPFMGHECTNSTGPAVLAMLSGAPIVPIAIYRRAPFKHVVRLFEPLTFAQDAQDKGKRDRLSQIKEMTLRVNNALEHMIKLQPELWFWLHNRWK